MSTAIARRPQLVVSEEIIEGATETALFLPVGINENEWAEVGEKLGRAHRASAWWIGDWINYGKTKWGEKYEEAERITGLSYAYLSQCAAVARRFEFVERSTKLTWTHHFKAKSLAEPEKWLARAENEEWSVRDLVEHAHSAPRTAVFPTRRHAAVIDAAAKLVTTARPHGQTQVWVREMTDDLTPPEAKKQLTILKNAASVLAEVIAAVEYRAATPHRFMGR